MTLSKSFLFQPGDLCQSRSSFVYQGPFLILKTTTGTEGIVGDGYWVQYKTLHLDENEIMFLTMSASSDEEMRVKHKMYELLSRP